MVSHDRTYFWVLRRSNNPTMRDDTEIIKNDQSQITMVQSIKRYDFIHPYIYIIFIYIQ